MLIYFQSYVEALLESGRHRPAASDSSDSDTNTTHNVTSVDDKPKHYYKFMLPFKFIRIRFDRLALLALLDRYFVIIPTVINGGS